MAAKAPSTYMQERMKVGKDEVNRRLKSHLVSMDVLKANDYASFLDVRAKEMHQAIIRICT